MEYVRALSIDDFNTWVAYYQLRQKMNDEAARAASKRGKRRQR